MPLLHFTCNTQKTQSHLVEQNLSLWYYTKECKPFEEKA